MRTVGHVHSVFHEQVVGLAPIRQHGDACRPDEEGIEGGAVHPPDVGGTLSRGPMVRWELSEPTHSEVEIGKKSIFRAYRQSVVDERSIFSSNISLRAN